MEKFLSLAAPKKQGFLGNATVMDAADAEKLMGDEFLEHQKNLFEAIFKGISDAMMLADSERRIIMCNPAVKTIFGYEEKELLGRRTEILYESPEEFERQGRLRYNPGGEEKSEPYTVNYRRKNGEIFPGETIGTPIHDGAGNVLGFLGVIRDITERKKAEEELRESQNNFFAAIDNMAESFALFDADDRLIQCNDKYLEAFAPELKGRIAPGISFEDLVKIAADHNFYPLDGRTKEQAIQDRLERHRNPQGPFEVRRDDGRWFFFNETKIPGGGIVLLRRDITERKQAEIELRRARDELEQRVEERTRELSESESRVRSVMENIVEAVITIGEDGAIETFNPAAEKMFGYTASEILGENVSLLADGPEASEHDQYIHIYLKTGKGRIVGKGFREVRGRHKDGTIFPAELAISEILGGRRRKFVGTLRDVTERKAVEEKIRLSQARLKEAQRIASMGNWEWNIQTNELFWSDEIFKIFGLDSRTFEPTYEAFLKTVHPDDRELVEKSVERALTEKETYDIDHRIVLPDGTERVVNEQGEVTFSARGEPLFMAGTVQDITERKRTEEGLRKAMERAEFANRAKTEFLAHMSHELRTPLNAILGYSDILKSQMFGPLGNEKYPEYVENISAAGEHLLGILSDILDVSKVEAGELDIEDGEIDITAAIKECKTMMLERADIAKVGLTSRVAGDMPRLRADGRRLRQILLNLLTNAVKFTSEKGKVSITAKTDPAGAIVIRVADTGIGIAPENIGKILKPFGQVKEAYVGNPGEGSGLGLSLVNSLMDLHGGTLDIDSTPGEGTTVSITFPPERTLTAA